METDRIVAYLPAWLDGCALYRMWLPHLHTPGSKFVFSPQRIRLDEFADANICVVQRQCTQPNYEALKMIKNSGSKIIYDLDDDLWSLPASNPAKDAFVRMRDGFGICAEVCDAVTVSTKILASAVRTALPKLKLPIFVVRNAVDFALFNNTECDCVQKEREDKVVVGWGGSNTHAGDIVYAWGALEELIEEEENLYLEFVGMAPPKRIEKHPRVRVRQWVPVAQYGARLKTWGWDVVLAPLDANRFNRSKSNIKFLEAGAIGAVALGSPVQPYNEFCAHASELQWLLCSSKRDWKIKIKELIHNPALRVSLAKKIRDVTEQHFSVDRVVETEWKAAFEGAA